MTYWKEKTLLTLLTFQRIIVKHISKTILVKKGKGV